MRTMKSIHPSFHPASEFHEMPVTTSATEHPACVTEEIVVSVTMRLVHFTNFQFHFRKIGAAPESFPRVEEGCFRTEGDHTED